MEDMNVILTLKAVSLRAKRLYSSSYNNDRFLGPVEDYTAEIFIRETTPSECQELGDQQDLSSRL